MTAAVSSAAAYTAGNPRPAPAYQPESSAWCATPDSTDVGQARLSDAERETAITRSGEALIAAYTRKEAARRRYGESNCLTDKADEDCAAMDARRALAAMQALIRGRSSSQVRRMEVEQAGRMAREPGAEKG